MIEKLAYSLGINNENPNIELALELIKTKDIKGIDEIAAGLKNPKEQIANDCIKVLYEIGERQPGLISKYAGDFIGALSSRNNRMVWGAMTALSKIAHLKPQEIFDNLDKVIKAYKNGSVITVDNSIGVFAGVAASGKEYEEIIFPVIIGHLKNCRPKEVGQHSERAFACVNAENATVFRSVLLERRDSLSEPQKKRVDKLLDKINRQWEG
jgi:hypothetical protein